MLRCRKSFFIFTLFLGISLIFAVPLTGTAFAENKEEFGRELETGGIDEEGMPASSPDDKRLAKEENVGIRPVGAPIFTYSSDFGPSMGAHLAIYNYGDASVKPYKYLYRFQGLFGTNGDMNNYFSFDAPQIFGSKFRLQAKAAYQVINNYNYFGVGNNTSDKGPKSFYEFKRTTPSLIVNLYRDIWSKFKIVGGILAEKRYVKAAPTSKLEADKPRGYKGGVDSELRLGLVYDSRDNEAMTGHGNFIDIYAELPLQVFGSSFNYARFTFANRNYFTLIGDDRLVWANRIIVKSSVGSVPFYEMAKFGGFEHFDGIGGNNTLRGIKQARYIDRSALVINEELRLKLTDFYVGRQRFDIYSVAFGDFGRVFSSLKAFTPAGLHPAGGGGVRICWNKTFVLAPDVGFSSEGYSVYFKFNNVF